VNKEPTRGKRLFNVTSEQDVDCYKQFLIRKTWGQSGCPFILEFPYTTVPDMIKDKLIRKFLHVDV
jgi:hypothetical protein